MGHTIDMIDEQICNLEDILIQKTCQQDIDSVDIREMGAAIDMIKDLAEYKRNIYEAYYYKSITSAMAGKDDAEHGMDENIDDIVETIKDIWNEADPEHRQLMKGKISSLLNIMV